MPRRVTRSALVHALRRAELAMRWAGQQTSVPDSVRRPLAAHADKLRRLLDRLGKK